MKIPKEIIRLFKKQIALQNEDYLSVLHSLIIMIKAKQQQYAIGSPAKAMAYGEILDELNEEWGRLENDITSNFYSWRDYRRDHPDDKAARDRGRVSVEDTTVSNGKNVVSGFGLDGAWSENKPGEDGAGGTHGVGLSDTGKEGVVHQPGNDEAWFGGAFVVQSDEDKQSPPTGGALGELFPRDR